MINSTSSDQPKKVIIIGAGLAGLSAGCYLQMNGYETEIFESHNRSGGLCTAWERNGYTLENCIHWLCGTIPTDSFYPIWDELAGMKNFQSVNTEEYMTIENRDGTRITVFSDIDKLRDEMLRIGPEDKDLIDELAKTVKKFTKFKIPTKPPEISTFIDNIAIISRLLPYLGDLKKWNKLTIAEYARKYKNPVLRNAIKTSLQSERAALAICFLLAWTHNKSAAYPVGGSLKLISHIEQRYLELGGKIHFNSKVTKIDTEANVATGVSLESDEKRDAAVVISAADGYQTIFRLLEGRYLNGDIKDLYTNHAVMPSYVQVYLGVNRTFEGEPTTLALELEQPLVIDDSTTCNDIIYRILNIDPTLAPEGKTVITAKLKTFNDQYWVKLREDDRTKYDLEKDRLAETVIETLDNKYGNIRSAIEVIDVSTPATVVRYTNNWKGSHEGWITTPKIGFKNIKKVLPGLKNFYMAGQWVERTGGLPTSALSGKQVAQIICKKDKRKFVVG